MKKRNMMLGLAVATLAFFATPAQADLILTAGDADYSGPGFQPFVLDAEWLEDLVGSDEDLFLRYKDESDGDEEEGPWSDGYSTNYGTDGDGDLTSLWIENDGDPGSGALWLVVKDGAKHDPAWYVFDISDWDGEEDIQVTGLFPEGGSISNVQIYGPESAIPEPGTLALFGAALIGIGLARRRVTVVRA